MKKETIWTKPLHLHLDKAFNALWRGLAGASRRVWMVFNALIVWLADETHWKGVKRLAALVIIVLLIVAVRYGWLANAKLDWLASLFSPLLGKSYPWGVTP